MPPASPWHRSCMCVGLEEFSGACRRNALHYTPLSPAPARVQSKVLLAPVSACARLNNLPPLRSSFHILTSQTSRVFQMRLALFQTYVCPFLQWCALFPRSKEFFCMCVYSRYSQISKCECYEINFKCISLVFCSIVLPLSLQFLVTFQDVFLSNSMFYKCEEILSDLFLNR